MISDFRKKNAIRCTFTTTTTTTTRRNYISASPHFDSDIVTKIEEFPDVKFKQKVLPLTGKELEISRSSASLIQNILKKSQSDCEPTNDLFETVKKAKSKINRLSESNNEINKKLTFLYDNIKNSSLEMRMKEGDVKRFLQKISDDEKTWVSRVRRERLKSQSFERSNQFSQEICSQTSRIKISEGSSSSKIDSCLVQSAIHICENTKSLQESTSVKKMFIKNSSTGEDSPVSLEEALGAFLASSLELERNHFFSQNLPHICQFLKREILKESSETQNVEKSGGDLTVTDASMQMMSNVCNSFNETSEQCQDLQTQKEGRSEMEIWNSQTEEIPEKFEFCIEESESSAEEEAMSETDSIFEEALSDPFPLCLGGSSKRDVTKTVRTIRSTHIVSESHGSSFSWIKKLKEEIKTKIKNFKQKVVINDEQKMKMMTKNSKFLLTADTPIGLFDLTLRQVEDKGNIVEFDCLKVPAFTVAPVTTTTTFNNNDSFDSNPYVSSGEDEYEEEHEDEDEEEGNTSDEKNTENMMTSSVVSKKPSFFEIVVCTPKCFAQEMVQKTPIPQNNDDVDDDNDDDKNNHNDLIERGRRALELLTENGFFLNTEFSKGSDVNPRILLQDSSHDLVIYIQVEEEKSSGSNESNPCVCAKKQAETEKLPLKIKRKDGKASSSASKSPSKESKHSGGSKDSTSKKNKNLITSVEEIPVKIIKKMHNGSAISPAEIGKEIEKIMKSKIPFLINGEVDSILSDEVRSKTDKNSSLKQDGSSRDMKSKAVKFTDEFSEALEEKEIRQLFPEPEAPLGNAVKWVTLENILEAEVRYPQTEVLKILRYDTRKAGQQMFMVYETFDSGDPELGNALNLIHKLENDVYEVKLRDAIMILPRLESELRRHLQGKLKGMKTQDSVMFSNSVDNFFSAVDFWPRLVEDEERDDSEERLENLLSLLSHLEEAVKADDSSKDRLELCNLNSSKVYKLLRALTHSIRELEDKTTVVSLAETLEIASQLDNAVREYDSIVKKEPNDYVREKPKKVKGNEKGDEWAEDIVVKDHLKNVRKKVFEIVEGEAEEVEYRIEKDFDRLDRLEKENEEALKFIEAFLEKTQRRAGELEAAKTSLKELFTELNNIYVKMLSEKERKKKQKEVKEIEKEKEEGRRRMEQNKREEEEEEEEGEALKEDEAEERLSVKDTVSGLLMALDQLKNKARQKNKLCMELLGVKNIELKTPKIAKASKSSFTSRTSEMSSVIKEVKQVGHNSLYLTWTPPEGIDFDSLLGYEIFVNGKLNQRVRNPQRLQAVLYSIVADGGLEIQLYALTEGVRILVGSINYDPTL